jgi:hypothetical protein
LDNKILLHSQKTHFCHKRKNPSNFNPYSKKSTNAYRFWSTPHIHWCPHRSIHLRSVGSPDRTNIGNFPAYLCTVVDSELGHLRIRRRLKEVRKLQKNVGNYRRSVVRPPPTGNRSCSDIWRSRPSKKCVKCRKIAFFVKFFAYNWKLCFVCGWKARILRYILVYKRLNSTWVMIGKGATNKEDKVLIFCCMFCGWFVACLKGNIQENLNENKKIWYI